MPKFVFDKLVRDKVVQSCLDDPEVLETDYFVLGDVQYTQQLINKISEEAAEIPIGEDYDREEALSELSDLQDVVDALRVHLGFSVEEVQAEGQRKTDKKGGFDKRHFIKHVVLADDSEWIEHFRAQPDKYQEEE